MDPQDFINKTKQQQQTNKNNNKEIKNCPFCGEQPGEPDIDCIEGNTFYSIECDCGAQMSVGFGNLYDIHGEFIGITDKYKMEKRKQIIKSWNRRN